MLTIPSEGDPYDFYSSADGPDIGVFPGGLIQKIPDPLPIRLQRGDKFWGGKHIALKHGHWLKKEQLDVHEMVWLKLRQQGTIYTTEEGNKLKISLRISPTALLVLRLIKTDSDVFMTVVSVYPRQQSLDGTNLGAYKPTMTLPPGDRKLTYPLYTLPTSTPAQLQSATPTIPTVSYKRKREFTTPTGNGQ